jgi:hypothetical protein
VDAPALEDGAEHRRGKDGFLFGENGVKVPVRGVGWKDGAEARDELEWRVSRNDSGLLRVDQGTGGKVTLVARQLPRANSEFGEREISTVLRAGPCQCESKPVLFRLFFPRDEETNPGGEMPNWAFYWKQTKAGRSLRTGKEVPFTFAERVPPNPGALTSSGKETGRYIPHTDTIYVSKLQCCPRQPGGVGDKGIDCFANTLNHEARHREQFLKWWGPKLERYCGDAAFLPGTCKVDMDLDFVPNDVEKEQSCDSYEQRSCPALPTWCGDVTDLEHDAYQVGWEWKPGTANAEDWACPGSNCPEE